MNKKPSQQAINKAAGVFGSPVEPKAFAVGKQAQSKKKIKIIEWFKHQIELWKIEEEERVLLSNNYMTKEAERNPAKFMKDYMDIQDKRKKAREAYRAKGQ